MINRISFAKLQEKLKFFIKFGIPYRKTSTLGRTLLVSKDWESWENKDSRFPAKELQFIKSVKEYTLKHKTYRNVRNYFGRAGKEGANKKIKYFHYNKNIAPNSFFKDCYEVDIKNCYFDTAYFHYNLFSKELYEKGLTVSKKSRLAAIGSYAKVKSITDFDGKIETKLPDERSKKTEFLWHTICHKIGKSMFRASKQAKKDFLFFWVDGIFLKSKAEVKIVQQFLKKNGYKSTVSYCEWIKFNENGLVVKSTEKAKWVTVIKKEVVIRKGIKYNKIIRTRELRDERPFPYKMALSDKEINNLNSAE